MKTNPYPTQAGQLDNPPKVPAVPMAGGASPGDGGEAFRAVAHQAETYVHKAVQNNPERLKAESTRLLLKWLDLARKCGGSYSPTGCSSSSFQITVEELKAELATREHVPNKREAKAIRRARAKGH